MLVKKYGTFFFFLRTELTSTQHAQKEPTLFFFETFAYLLIFFLLIEEVLLLSRAVCAPFADFLIAPFWLSLSSAAAVEEVQSVYLWQSLSVWFSDIIIVIISLLST